MKTLYGKNPFLIVNNKLFFPSCQSPILIFSGYRIGVSNAMGNFVPLDYPIAGGAEDVKTAVEVEPVS